MGYANQMTSEEQRRKKWKEIYQRNKEKRKEWSRNYYRKRVETDPEFNKKKSADNSFRVHFKKLNKAIDEMLEKGRPVE